MTDSDDDNQLSLGDLRAPQTAQAPETAYHQLHLDPKFHQQRHVYLHQALDELAADWIRHNVKPGGRSLTTTSIMELMQWSYTQTQQPTEPEADA